MENAVGAFEAKTHFAQLLEPGGARGEHYHYPTWHSGGAVGADPGGP